ncbi:MAG: DUF4118 domain-containing protein [Betaproteobacteria bacterium]
MSNTAPEDDLRIRNAQRWSPGGWRPFLWALAMVSGAFLVRYGLHDFLQEKQPFTLFTFTAILTAFFFGYGPAVMVILVGLLLGVYYFVPPFDAFLMPEFLDLVYVGGYLLISSLSVYMIEGLQRSKYALRLMHEVLESRLEMIERSNAERTLAERVAQENSERFDSLATGLPQILYMRRIDGEFEYLNEQFYRSTGLTAGALGHDGWLAAVQPDDIQVVNEAFERVVATGIKEELRLRLRMADGPYELFGGPLSRLDGKHGKDIKWVAGLVYPHERRAQYR